MSLMVKLWIKWLTLKTRARTNQAIYRNAVQHFCAISGPPPPIYERAVKTAVDAASLIQPNFHSWVSERVLIDSLSLFYWYQSDSISSFTAFINWCVTVHLFFTNLSVNDQPSDSGNGETDIEGALAWWKAFNHQ